MSVRVGDDAIVLEGRCSAADAETLLLALLERPSVVIDVSGVQKLHMAVAQILLALGQPVRGQPEAPFLVKYIFTPLVSPSDKRADCA